MENKGFTLIELLIVIAIVGILVGIALPSYQAHVLKANRIDVKLAMIEMSLVAERQFARQGTYPSDAQATSVQLPPSNIYETTFSRNANLVQFEIKAVPKGAQLTDDCGIMKLTQTGLVTVKETSVTAADIRECW